jgi:hypothetical protein
MRKSLVLGLLVILIGLLCSFRKNKPFVVNPNITVSVSDTLVDSTLYNSYLIHFKQGVTQVLQYPSDWDVNYMLGPKRMKNVVKIDTLQLNVFYNELN